MKEHIICSLTVGLLNSGPDFISLKKQIWEDEDTLRRWLKSKNHVCRSISMVNWSGKKGGWEEKNNISLLS